MKHTVDWLPSAQRELADLWNNAADRADVTIAADAIDAVLERNPLSLGESRGGLTRIAFVPPLGVLFDVDAAQRRVVVWDVWRCSN